MTGLLASKANFVMLIYETYFGLTNCTSCNNRSCKTHGQHHDRKVGAIV